MLENIHSLNQMMDVRTGHPLVTVIRPKENLRCDGRCDFHVMVIRGPLPKGCSDYGLQDCDNRRATVSFYLPGERIDTRRAEHIIAFDNDYFKCVADVQPYFSYSEKESLHLSERDHRQINSVVEQMKVEIGHDIDDSTCSLISDIIRLLMDMCHRFYKYQFILREHQASQIVSNVDAILDNYFFAEILATRTLPDDDYFAERIGHTAAYLNDMLKVTTGKTLQELSLLKLADKSESRQELEEILVNLQPEESNE